MNEIIDKNGKWSLFSAVLFGLVFCDSLITYFASRIGGVRPALIILILFAVFALLKGYKKILPSERVMGWLALMVFGFLMGIVSAPDIGIQRLPELASAVIAFLIGYYFFRFNTDVNKIYWFLFILSALYTSICVLAILRVAPQYFPIEVSLWAHGYTINERPAITTDQNFQFFYIFLPVLLIMLPIGRFKFLGVLVLLIAAAFVLVRLQTRSGVLVFVGGFLLALAYPFVSKKSDKKKVIYLLLSAFLIVLLSLPLVMSEVGPLLVRFLSEGKEQATSAGRLTSALYIFDVVWNPLYWLPQGNPTYLEGYNKPHSNIAAVYLEAGIFGLVGWVMVFVRPVFLLAKQYYSRNGDIIAGLVFVASVMILVLQLSLNVPVMDQVWLWAGALNGVLAKVKSSGRENHAKSAINEAEKKINKKTSLRYINLIVDKTDD